MNANKKDVSTLPPIEAWQTETLRLTLFHSSDAQIVEPTWWDDLQGGPPESRDLRPKIGEQRDIGSFEDGRLVLAIRQGRIDWLFTVDIDAPPNGEGIPTIGDFPACLGKFHDLMLSWFGIGTCPSAKRLAFGVVLLQPVENLALGYRQLSAYLPCVELDYEGSSDFLYQINRPVSSSSEVVDLRVNRLSKWSVARQIRMRGEIPIGSPSVTISPSEESFACRLELDINTTPDFEAGLTREQLPVVFQELVNFGKQIAQEGDSP